MFMKLCLYFESERERESDSKLTQPTIVDINIFREYYVNLFIVFFYIQSDAHTHNQTPIFNTKNMLL